MRSLQLIPENLVSRLSDTKPEQHFYLLGSEIFDDLHFLSQNIQAKLSKESTGQVSGLWGTLGFADGKKRNWVGELDFSGYGNDLFKGPVKKEVDLIKTGFGLKTEHRVLERFISFDRTSFNMNGNGETTMERPVFRLTLMLETDESALVMLQHKIPQTDKEYVEYIQPEATPEHNTDQRDRLDYFFSGPNGFYSRIENDVNSDTETTEQEPRENFLLKIITFKRRPQYGSYKLLEELEKKLITRQMNKKSVLLKFHGSKNEFEPCQSMDLNPQLKTLFLIHGTFTNTLGSFGSLYGGNNDWLKSRLWEYGGIYDQIIAYNHPTVIAGAKENIDMLFEIFGTGFKFMQPVDIIATSQGGLLAQYLANQDHAGTKIPVGKTALVASANGVDYFTAGANISKFLTVIKYILDKGGKKAAAFIVGLASQSADFLLKQPGFRLMTPGNEALTQIMNSIPSSADTIYYPIIDDFDKFSDIDKKTLKPVYRILSLLVMPILGKYNDLVVRTEYQFIVPKDYCCIPDYDPSRYKEYKCSALHGKAIELELVQKKVSDFLEKKECLQ